MDGVNKVLWKEGLFLTPQHFQSFDKYHEWLSSFLTQTVSQYHWGFYRLTIDEEAISNWQMNVGAVQAVMRGGLVLDCPGGDSLPPSRSFESLFTPDRSFLTAYLCLPRLEQGRPAVKMNEQGSGQHRPFERIVKESSDMVTGTGAREIEFIVKRPEIRFDGEALDSFDAIPMARIILKGAGKPALAPGFLPPSLSLTVSGIWMQSVEQLLYQVNSLATELRSRLTYGSDNSVNLTMADLPAFMQARELTTSVPMLSHFYNNPDCHPSKVYYAISDMLARLGLLFGTLGGNSQEDFPAYNHESPAEGFMAMVNKIKQMFTMVGRTRDNEMPLMPVADKPNEFACSLGAATFSDNEEFYLWARSDLPDDKFITQFVVEFRLAAASRMDHLTIYALPGVGMNQVMNPPVSLPSAQGGHYFRIDTRDDLWREVKDEKELRVAGRRDAFPNLEMRLYVLRV